MCGEIRVDTAKNSVLPILASTILCEDTVTLHNIPKFSDIINMCQILTSLGATILHRGDSLMIDNSTTHLHTISSQLSQPIRSSIFTLGALLGRFGVARVSYPGGCDIGLRPIDIHLKGLRELGVIIIERHGIIQCDASHIHGGEVYLDYPSVGATENLIMASVLGKPRRTILHNVAREPEVSDLINFLNSMGAKITGAGKDTITIHSVNTLHGIQYTPIPDRIIAGTYLIAGAMTGGEVCIQGCNPKNLQSLLQKLRKSSCKIVSKSDKIILKADSPLVSFDIINTQPYPGFPTDLQSQMLTMSTICSGYTIIRENLFESRYKLVPELIKMGANIVVKDRVACVCGVPHLSGASVYATDLRGGASLVLAGLVAAGYTTIHDIHHIERGYHNIEGALRSLGADIIRVE